MQAIVNDGRRRQLGTANPLSDETLDEILVALFDQAVDAIRSHADWRPTTREEPDLFGQTAPSLDGKLITELVWIFGAEDGAPVPFEAAADAAEINPGRFRRACQRSFPKECAWIETNIGPLQGV